MTGDKRLAQQLQFVIEIDRLKHILRQTWLTDKSRRENSAEHSWHLAVMALLLHEYASPCDVDLLRVLKMVVVHDLVEIDAGDTFVYDDAAAAGKPAREQQAAERIFGLLPPDQAAEFRAIWEEFEARRTAEARFAAALDRLQPILHNFHTQGKAWQEHGIHSSMVVARNQHMADGSPQLWQYARQLITEAVASGYLTE